MTAAEVKRVVGKLALNLLADSSDSSSASEDEELLFLSRRESHKKIEQYVPNTVAHYNLSDFRSHFRMSRSAVEPQSKTMSVWKKAAKAHQKTHKERHQPEERQHLGLLEKKKDYQRRAKDYNEKKETLKILKKRALNKNPDEFYHHMINSKVEDGVHFEKETEEEDTPEQVQLMRTQDLKYIITMRTKEQKKIEKLQAQLHLTSVDHSVTNTHIYFEKKNKKEAEKRQMELLAQEELPDVDPVMLQASSRKREALYKELAKRIKREKELSVIQRKLEINKAVENKKGALKPKKIKRGTKTSAPVYVWKYERKK